MAISTRHCEVHSTVAISIRHCEALRTVAISIRHCEVHRAVAISIRHCEVHSAVAISTRHCEAHSAVAIYHLLQLAHIIVPTPAGYKKCNPETLLPPSFAGIHLYTHINTICHCEALRSWQSQSVIARCSGRGNLNPSLRGASRRGNLPLITARSHHSPLRTRVTKM